MDLTLTYGIMPSREQYDKAWNYGNEDRTSALFVFGKDRRLGSVSLTQDQLWEELQKAHREWDSPNEDPEAQDAAGEWCSNVLGCLGIEWV